jgi:hypothetical protein
LASDVVRVKRVDHVLDGDGATPALDGDDVEANRVRMQAMAGQVAVRDMDHAPSLGRPDRLEGAPLASAPPGADLAEDECVAIEGN